MGLGAVLSDIALDLPTPNTGLGLFVHLICGVGGQYLPYALAGPVWRSFGLIAAPMAAAFSAGSNIGLPFIYRPSIVRQVLNEQRLVLNELVFRCKTCLFVVS